MNELRIDDLGDLDHLAHAMTDIGGQASELGAYAHTWVFRREAFETSEVCLLRPLGWVLGELAGSLDDFVRDFARGWGDLTDDLAATGRDLVDAEFEVGRLLLGLVA